MIGHTLMSKITQILTILQEILIDVSVNKSKIKLFLEESPDS